MFVLIRKYLDRWAVLAAVLFLIVQVSCDLYLPTVTANIIDEGIAKNDIHYIIITGFKMLVVAILGLIASTGNLYFAATQSQLMGRKIRSALYRRVVYFSDQDLSQFGNASLITRATNDVVQIQNVVVNVLRMMIMSPITLIGAIILAFTRNAELTITFIVSLIILALLIFGIMKFANPLFRSLQKKTDGINLVFREGLTGVRVIRAFNRDQYEQDRFDHANREFTTNAKKVYSIVAFMFPIMTLILDFTNVAIVWFGSLLINHQALAVGNLVAFMTYSTQILVSFMMFSFIFVMVPRASASAARINEVLAVKNSIQDAPEDQLEHPSDHNTLEFDHVNFKYPDADKLALEDVNFKAHAGQTVAIIGNTGSGKSSLINLIPRLYDTTSGEVKVNGVNVKSMIQQDLHQLVSITQQQAVLFSGTVRANMKFGNEKADDDMIWKALDIAQATDFIKEQGGLDAKVEQNGNNFSGGQKQRLAIARTIIKKAAVYVFDDSFSALDFETDARLRTALSKDQMIQSAVTVIVAQRVSTIANADLILVINNGKVVGEGTHQELMDTNPTYQAIVHSQIREEES